MPAIPAIILDHLPPSLTVSDIEARSGSLLFHRPLQRIIFTKVAKGKDVPQLIGEAEGIQAMSSAAPELVPHIYAFGYDNPQSRNQAYMITQWFEMAGSWRDSGHQRELGRKLAEMHRYRAEAGHGDRFGFGVPTHCGVTEQDNTWEDRWDVFYRDRRLGDLVRRIGDAAISETWEKMKDRCAKSFLHIPLLKSLSKQGSSSPAFQHRPGYETRYPPWRSLVRQCRFGFQVPISDYFRSSKLLRTQRS